MICENIDQYLYAVGVSVERKCEVQVFEQDERLGVFFDDFGVFDWIAHSPKERGLLKFFETKGLIGVCFNATVVSDVFIISSKIICSIILRRC